MPIEVKCTNIVKFDPANGKYVYCNQRIKVPDSKAGGIVACPKCGSSVEVIRSEPERLPRARQTEDFENIGGPLDAGVPAPTGPTLQAPPTAAAQTFATHSNCINCHAPLPQGSNICPSCGREQPAIEIKKEQQGYQGWFREQLSEDTSPVTVLFLALGLCGILMFLCVSYVMVEHKDYVILLGIAIVAPIFMVAAIVGFIASKQRRAHETWMASVTRVGRPWALTLIFLRALNWRQLGVPFSARKVLDRRDMAFTDHDLLQTEGLNDFQAMDLEGTQVSDEALQYLHKMPNLQFIVLLRTNVTAEGVRKLQASRQALWIWH